MSSVLTPKYEAAITFENMDKFEFDTKRLIELYALNVLLLFGSLIPL